MADLNATILDTNEEDEKKHEPQEVKMESEDIVNNEVSPCDICKKTFEKKGQKSLHMKKMHNLKTMQYTPIPRKVGRPASRFICKICKEKKKTDSELRNHMEVNHKNNSSAELQIPKKRQLHSFTCTKCNSTFDSRYKMNKHIKEQHEGKNILSPERKVAKIDQIKDGEAEVEKGMKEENNNKKTVTILKKEYENLHDLLVKTGREKEKLDVRVTELQ